MGILENYQRIQQTISSITDRSVKIVGVSKFQPIEKLQTAWDAGILDLGENRVQEGRKKSPLLSPEIQWHLIGHLQKNKVRHAVECFHWIHSVDSWELAQLLDREAEKQGKKPKILIQVNIAEEVQKFGVSEEEFLYLAEKIKNCNHLQLSGMMTLAPLVEDVEETRPVFIKGKLLFEKMQKVVGADTQYLSMGMSNDYKIALEEGANMVRIGRMLFEDN